jgi:signal transduction histidine kinase
LASIIEKREALHKQLKGQLEKARQAEAEMRRLEGLANLGSATAMIAHEINNLLTPLSNYADLALKNPDDRQLVEKALTKTASNCKQAAKIMESILAMANGGGQEKAVTPLPAIVEVVFACLARDFAKDGITVEVRIPEWLTVWAAPVQIEQVLMNLILNARDAMSGRGGRMTISAEGTGDAVRICVSDTGTGIRPEDLKNIFNDFFTTKNGRAGAGESTGYGLGLAFCKKIIDAHNGTITVESEPNIGTTFAITLAKSN